MCFPTFKKILAQGRNFSKFGHCNLKVIEFAKKKCFPLMNNFIMGRKRL